MRKNQPRTQIYSGLVLLADMQYNNNMKSYLNQLEALSSPTGIPLVKFFELAGVPASTYYRAKKGTDLRMATAKRVEDEIRLYTLHKSAEGAGSVA